MSSCTPAGRMDTLGQHAHGPFSPPASHQRSAQRTLQPRAIRKCTELQNHGHPYLYLRKERRLLSLEFKCWNKAEWYMLLGHSERLGLCIGNLDFVAQTWLTYTTLFISQLTTCNSLLCCGQAAVQAFGLKTARPRGLGTHCDPSKPPNTKTIWNPKAVFSPRLYLSVQVDIFSSTNRLVIQYGWTGKIPMDFNTLCPK